MRPGRIAVAHGSNDLYGASRVLLDDVGILRELGHAVAVILPADGPLTERLEAAGAEVRVEDLKVLRRAALRQVRLPLVLPAAMAEADLVVLWTLALAAYLPALRARRKPTVCSVHEIQPSRGGRVLAAAASLLADRLMANSAATADWVQGASRRASRPLVAYPAAPSYAPLPPAPRQGPVEILIAGRVNGHKGHLEAVEACRLARRGGVDLRLTLLGAPYEGQERHLEALLAAVADADWAEYRGQVDEIGPFLAAAHLLLVPSTRPEPFGIVALEGWAGGREVLAADTGGLAEAADLIGAAKFPPGDVEAMAELIGKAARGERNGQAPVSPDSVYSLCSAERRSLVWREVLDSFGEAGR